MAYPLADWASGKAIFSTRNGKFARRQAVVGMSIVIRSDPLEDRDRMAAKLQAEFPAVCKALISPMPRVGDYFDGYDQELLGGEFLRAVLLHIVAINNDQARRVQDYVGRWIATNGEVFALLTHEHTLEHLFTEEDLHEYGKDFLGDALAQIKQFKDRTMRIDSAWEAEHLQGQYARMANEQRHSFHPQTLGYRPPPSSLLGAQNPRATSNPERHVGHLHQDPLPAIPSSQHSSQQCPWAGDHISSPTNVLRHAHIENADRFDVRAHPAPPTIGNYVSSSMGYHMSIPALGFPSLSSYGYQTRVPIADRHRSVSNYYPKGKKNPVKRSSDDARRSSFEVERRSRSFSHRRSSNLGALQMAQSPQSMISSTHAPYSSSQPPRNAYTSVSMPVFGPQQQRNAPKLEDPSRANAPFHSPMNDERRQSENVQASQPGRYISKPYTYQPGPATPRKGFPGPAICRPDQPKPGQQTNDWGDQYGTGKPVPFKLSHTTQSADPRTHRHWSRQKIPTAQAGGHAVSPMTVKAEVSPPPLPSQSQSQTHLIPQRSHIQESPRRNAEYFRGFQIWIGGIPPDTSQETIAKMLDPCRGLLCISPPRLGTHAQRDYAYVFASFESQDDAKVALERIPQTRFPHLPEGTTLRVNWPRKHDTTPRSNWNKDTEFTRHDMQQVSPTRARCVEGAGDSSVSETSKEALSIARNSNDRPSTRTTAITHVSGYTTHSDFDPPTEAHSSLLVAQNHEPMQPEPQPRATKPLSENRDTAGAKADAGDLLSNPGESTLANSTKANTDLSAIDPTSDRATTCATVLGRPQKAQGLNSEERRDQTVGLAQPKKGTKKKDKKGRVRSTEALVKSDGGQPSKSAPKSENIKPSLSSQVKPGDKAFLEKAALPEHGDDAARAQQAETEVPKPSAAMSSIRAREDSEAQPFESSSIVANATGKSMTTVGIEQLQSSPPEASTVGYPHADPPDDLGFSTGKQIPDRSPRSAVNGSVEAPGLGAVVSGFTLYTGEERTSHAMTRGSSSPTLIREHDASIGQSWTAPTSHWQTEPLSSVEYITPTESVQSIKQSSEHTTQKHEVDAEALRTLLQPDAVVQEEIKHPIYTEAKKTCGYGDRISSKTPDIPEPTAELKRLAPQALKFPKSESVANIRHAVGNDGKTSSTTPASNNGISKSKTAASPALYAQQFESRFLPLLSPISSPSPDLVQLSSSNGHQQPRVPPRSSSPQSVAAPIQTRQRKKPKQFTYVKEVNLPDTRAQSDEQTVQQSKDLDHKSPSPGEPRTPPVAQVKRSKQQRNSKRKNKQAKKPPVLAIVPSVQTPSPDRSTALPKPETPFRTDEGLSLLVSKPTYTRREEVYNMSSRFKITASVGYQSQQESASRTLNDQSHTQLSNLSGSLTSNSEIIKTPPRSSSHGEDGLEAALEEAGYQLLSDPPATCSFAIKHPDLARLELLGNYVDIRNRMDSLREQRKEKNVIDWVEAISENMPALSPRTPRGSTKGKQGIVENTSSIVGLEGSMEETAARLLSAKATGGETKIGESAGEWKIREAEVLLHSSPRLRPTYRDTGEWTSEANECIGENPINRLSAPSSPTRKYREGKVHNSTSASGTLFRQEKRLGLGSSEVMDRAGSAITTRPGSATAVVKIGRDEDISTVEDEFRADPNGFFRCGRTTKCKLDREAIFLSEQVPTPTLPQTVGHCTPSRGQSKKIASSPSAHRDRQSAVNLASNFATMKAVGCSIPSPSYKPENRVVECGKKAPTESNKVSVKMLESNIVGAWGQKSGAKHFEEIYETQRRHKNEHGIDEPDQKGLENTADAFLSTLPKPQDRKDQVQPYGKLPSTAEKEEEPSPILASNGGWVANVAPDASEPFQRQQRVEYANPSTQTKKKASSYIHSRMKISLPDIRSGRCVYQDTGIVNVSQETSDELRQGVKAPTPNTFVSSGESSIFVRDNWDDSEFPILSRGSKRSVKGGKSVSPTRGGYAAVAASKAKARSKAKGKQYESRVEEKAIDSDGWAVAAEEQWGFGKSGRKKRQQTL